MSQVVNPHPSNLDQQQILQRAFDESQDKLRVDASVSVESITGEVVVDITAASGDNIAITNQDGSNPLGINSDGSINVNVVNGSVGIYTPVNTYNEANSVASGILTTIVTQTMSINGRLICIEVSGSNIAEYTILVNGSKVSKVKTYFGSELNYYFDFKDGLLLNSGDIVLAQVLHNRPDLGDFNARIQTVG